MTTDLSVPLTNEEIAELTKCEQVIEAGLQTAVEVGYALAKIRDARLYRAKFRTFRDYVEHRWGFTARRAYQLIKAADVQAKMLEAGDKAADEPVSDYQVRKINAASSATEDSDEVISVAYDEEDGQQADGEGEPLPVINDCETSTIQEPESYVMDDSDEEGEVPLIDALGNEVDREPAMSAFRDRRKLTDLIIEIVSLAKQVNELRGQAVASYLPFESILAALNQARNAVRSAMPYAVTPDMPGIDDKYLTIGFVTESQYKRLAT